jgi:hypothetical protein
MQKKKGMQNIRFLTDFEQNSCVSVDVGKNTVVSKFCYLIFRRSPFVVRG